MTDSNGNYPGRGPTTPPYAFRPQVEVHEERLDGLEVELARQTLERSALMDKFEEHEAADKERHLELLERIKELADRFDKRIDAALKDAAGARALAERQPSQAEAVLVDMARADIEAERERRQASLEAEKERRAHFWSAVRRIGAWIVGIGGPGALVVALAERCGG